MRQSIRRTSFILAMLLLVSMIPVKAVADELLPYESVERPEEGVVIYHNKDGSYNLCWYRVLHQSLASILLRARE